MKRSVIVILLIFLVLISFLAVSYASGENKGNDITWDKTFGGSGEDMGFSIIQTEDRGYVVAGWTKSKGAGNSDAWIIKLDENGNL